MSACVALSRQQIRQIDRLAIEQIGIPSVVLMENAGRHCAEAALQLLAESKQPRVCVVCGRGNNGGDGFVVARHLHNRGVQVVVLMAAEPGELAGDARINHQIVQNMSLPVRPVRTAEQLADQQATLRSSDVIVDALLGTGFSGQVRQPLDRIIQAINAASRPKVLAVDVPSGLDCDTGQPAQACIRADLTVTFVARKIGFDRPPAPDYLGQVVVADIGAPPELVEQVQP